MVGWWPGERRYCGAMTINDTVSTPNGDGLAQAEIYIPGDDYRGEPSGIMVRHKKGVDIDATLCVEVLSTTKRDGWLVVYNKSQVTPTR